ncbi:MAG: division/cell wall cluster transcriptional repressor MraZ [Candidatus Omnitrophota bacterium]|nr:division/cell wall cluster transcriptional repressor MraZ [Candidatus Omnitrophota bacterium]
MWYGEYQHTLDDKDRFILPAKFRARIKSSRKQKFFLTRGLDGCLFFFSQDVWQNLEEKLKGISFAKQQSRSFNRLYFSGAQEVDIDTQGRVAIPGYLKEFAQIKKEIVIIGVADRVEIWDKLRWNDFYQQNKVKFEEVAENIFENQ